MFSIVFSSWPWFLVLLLNLVHDMSIALLCFYTLYCLIHFWPIREEFLLWNSFFHRKICLVFTKPSFIDSFEHRLSVFYHSTCLVMFMHPAPRVAWQAGANLRLWSTRQVNTGCWQLTGWSWSAWRQAWAKLTPNCIPSSWAAGSCLSLRRTQTVYSQYLWRRWSGNK